MTQTAAQTESKSAMKKKKAKAASDNSASAESASPSEGLQGAGESNNGDVYESPYIKELYK